MTEPHTQGPWIVVPSAEDHGPYVTDATGAVICLLYLMSFPGEATVAKGGRSKPIPLMDGAADANARLIAAAPTLLTAFKALVDECSGTPRPNVLLALLANADIVIADATGGSL